MAIGQQQQKASCDGCFFKVAELCALKKGKACSTFRPHHPEGLRPPRQMRFEFRQERARQAAWAFPDAEAQALLHA